MNHDYYLSEAKIKNFNRWNKEKEKSCRTENKKRQWREKSQKGKHNLWLEEVFAKPLAKTKKQIQNELKDKDIKDFYPEPKDLQNLPKNSILIKISFILEKPYTSKDEGEFHILNGRIFENPIVRDKFTGFPMVRPSTWKGHLRFAAGMIDEAEYDNKRDIIRRLFGSESRDDDARKGRLYFFPTFFESEGKEDVITPLKRDTRTPANGPITLEVMGTGAKGHFYLLYFPYPKGENWKSEDVFKDLKFTIDALEKMFLHYGFSAKKTSGFGVIHEEFEDFSLIWDKKNEAKNLDFDNINNFETLKDEIEKMMGGEK